MSAGDPSIISRALAWRAEGRRVALATVIQTWGSAPQPVGSQLAIDGRGISSARSRAAASRGK